MPEDGVYIAPDRHLEYPVFDVDNHMYENPDSFTKFIPSEYEGIVKYVQEGDRTRIAIKDHVDRTIPNPTFSKVAPPGGQQQDHLQRRSMAGLDAFYDVEPRYQLMKEFGISRALMWPTLGSVMDQALPEDPYALSVLMHALNQWMYEHWTFGYEDAVYPTPMISLAHVGRAIDELEWVAERGARVVYLSTAPASGFGGRRSIALPEFDPFWDLMESTGIVAGFHQIVNRRYPVDLLEMNGTPEAAGYFHAPGFPAYEKRSTAARAFQELTTPRWQPSDFLASMVGHGCLTRHPRLKVAIVEFFTHWVRPMLHQFEAAYERAPVLFDENPLDVLKRNVFIHLFHDPDPIEAIGLLGVENSMWGSDFPHPEGLRDPLAFSEDISSLPLEDRRLVMGGNLERLLNIT